MDKQTEKDEQDVTGDSPLVLLRKVFFPHVVEKVDKFRACFQPAVENKGQWWRVSSRAKMSQKHVFPVGKHLANIASHLHFPPFEDRLPNRLNQLKQISSISSGPVLFLAQLL